MTQDIDTKNAIVKVEATFDELELDELATVARDEIEQARAGWRNALRHAMAAGDALIAIQPRVAELGIPWKKWLKENLFVSDRTAQLYQQLARGREAIVCKQWLIDVHAELNAQFHYGWDGDVVLTAWIHDELVACCRPEIAKKVGEIMVRHAKAAGEAYALTVPLDAEFKIGSTWAGDEDLTDENAKIEIDDEEEAPERLNRLNLRPTPTCQLKNPRLRRSRQIRRPRRVRRTRAKIRVTDTLETVAATVRNSKPTRTPMRRTTPANRSTTLI